MNPIRFSPGIYQNGQVNSSLNFIEKARQWSFQPNRLTSKWLREKILNVSSKAILFLILHSDRHQEFKEILKTIENMKDSAPEHILDHLAYKCRSFSMTELMYIIHVKLKLNIDQNKEENLYSFRKSWIDGHKKEILEHVDQETIKKIDEKKLNQLAYVNICWPSLDVAEYPKNSTLISQEISAHIPIVKYLSQ